MDASHEDPSTPPTPESDEAAVLDALGAIVGDIAEHETRMGPRWRRIVRALHGLGVLDVVGRDWVRIGPDGLDFAPLTPREADRLARRLEDLESEVVPTTPGSQPPQTPLFVFPAPIVPSFDVTSSHHVGGAR